MRRQKIAAWAIGILLVAAVWGLAFCVMFGIAHYLEQLNARRKVPELRKEALADIRLLLELSAGIAIAIGAGIISYVWADKAHRRPRR